MDGRLIRIAETGYVPDWAIRQGIRRLLRQRLKDERRRAAGRNPSKRIAARLSRGPIAVETGEANRQHYEVPAEFFRLMLGPHLKYSACHWSRKGQSLEEAEAEMLALTCERAGLEDGMRVLDLGCGWGSLSLWIAERYPRCSVTAMSNSSSQAAFIRGRADELGLRNLAVRTDDINRFVPPERYDRILSVEMFEHMRNYRQLLSRVAGWLADDGRLFVHIFCHRRLPYLYEIAGDDDWMARHFFTGGLMPSLDLLDRFDDDLRVARQWVVDGSHYERTLLAWLRNLDARRAEALEILGRHYGREAAKTWFVRWRLFLLGCAELFGYRGGNEWMVAHHLLERHADHFGEESAA
jgi:cyclopropane-fatty-acyl-phospholipid synthase